MARLGPPGMATGADDWMDAAGGLALGVVVGALLGLAAGCGAFTTRDSGEAGTGDPMAAAGSPIAYYPALPGQSCLDRHCVEGAICVGYGDQAFCSERCDPVEAFCRTGALCLSVRGGETGACANYGTGDEGDPCSTATDCAPSLACVSERGTSPRCMRACDFTGVRARCPSERECAITTAGMDYGVCSPAE